MTDLLMKMGAFDFLDEVRRMNKRQLFYQVLNFGMIVSSALMIWKGLMVMTGSESPIVVVLSGSMEPAFQRGDLLFLTDYQEDPIRVGEIVVFKIEGRDIPIVHRVLRLHENGSMQPAFTRGGLVFLTNYQEDPIRVGEIVVFKIEGRDTPIIYRVLRLHEKEDGKMKFLTKGDNNLVDDRGLYAPGQLWLERKDVVGRARGFVPYVGIVTILMNDYPKFKYIVLAGLGLFVLIHRE